MIDARHFNASGILIPLAGKEGFFGRAQQSYVTIGLLLVSKSVGMMDLVSIPFICRVAALLLLLPFALCIGLDIIAYAIARTLRLSMLQARVPGSPSETSSAPSKFTDGYAITCPTDSHNHDQQSGQMGNSYEPARVPSGRRAGTRGSLNNIFTPPPGPEIRRESDKMAGAEDELSLADDHTNGPENTRQHVAPSPIMSAAPG